MSKNKPKNPKLWDQILDLGRGKSKKPVTHKGKTVNTVNDGDGFTTWPSAYGVGWALAQYKRLGGKWETKKKGNVHNLNIYNLIPPPPSDRDMIDQLPYISIQYKNRYNPHGMQVLLDKYFVNVFNELLVQNGYGCKKEEIGFMVGKLLPVILSLKEYYNVLRPHELALRENIPFTFDYLSTAQNPSYPSGHTTQAYYLAYKFSEDYPKLKGVFFNLAKRVAESRVDRGVHFISDNKAGVLLAKKLYEIEKDFNYNSQHVVYNVADRYIKLSAKRDDPKKKNTGHGGLDTWFSGHGGGVKDKDKATWGDWVAITPIKHTITKDNGEKKTYEAGDIVGLCAVSSTKEWASVTSNGKKPLKCMPRSKAYQMPKKDRASLARLKRKEEKKHKGKKPVNTPTFSDEAKNKLKKNK